MTHERYKTAENSLSDALNTNCRTRPRPPLTPMSHLACLPGFDLAYSDHRLECQNLKVAFQMGLYSDWRWHAALWRYLVAPRDIPRRIQRSRRKGWCLPPNTVYVGQPSMWDNPFTMRPGYYRLAVAQFRQWLLDSDDGRKLRGKMYLLRGKNLCCWCALDQPCHADVLLEFANRPFKHTNAKGVRSMIRSQKPLTHPTYPTTPSSMATKTNERMEGSDSMKPQRRLLNQATARPTPPSMAITTNERTNERCAMDSETTERCLISAHRIALEADRLKFCFSFRTVDTPLMKNINIALEIIDKQMELLCDIMATVPTEAGDGSA